MYHVTGTLITLILLYSLSYFFYRNRYYSLQFHRRLWNILLAFSFLFTALAGLFLALQINYKWNIPFIGTILKWHVEFGIGLAATGLIHFLWHLAYFSNIFKKKEYAEPVSSSIKYNSRVLSINLFLVGFVSTAVQLLMLKEVINITGGYELIAGTFLGSWLIGSAAGSLMASRSEITDLRKMNIFFFSAPVLPVILLLLLTRLFLKPGETPSFMAGAIYTFILLIPFCFISGFTFIKLVTLAAKDTGFKAGRSFSVETAGGIVSGIFISFLSSTGLNTYQAIILIAVLGFSHAVLSDSEPVRRKRSITRLIVLLISILVILTSPDKVIRQFLRKDVKVTESLDTPYGNITKGEYGGEKSTFYDQRLLYYRDDVMEREEDIHYAMLQSDNPENVLLISGSPASHIAEIMKYPVKRIVYVERDPALTENEDFKISINPVGLSVEKTDAFTYVRRTKEKFDVSILLLPPPSSLLLNRYYTEDFFKSIRKVMKPGGVFACSPGLNPDYLNQESVYLFSSIFKSLKSEFKNVIPVSGNKLYLIASDSSVSTSFCELSGKKGIVNVYVGPDYLSDDLITSKTMETMAVVNYNVKQNTILTPAANFYYQFYHLSRDLEEKTPSIILLCGLFILPLAFVKRGNMLMYSGSVALAGMEIILLLILQSVIGNMYQVTGLIVAGLMAGLATGSGTRIKYLEGSTFGFRALLLIVYYLLICLITGILIKLSSKALVIVILMTAGFIPALITGNLFRGFTGSTDSGAEISSVYGADLAGSATGFILFAAFFVPFFGIQTSLLTFPILILAGYLFTLSSGKR